MNNLGFANDIDEHSWFASSTTEVLLRTSMTNHDSDYQQHRFCLRHRWKSMVQIIKNTSVAKDIDENEWLRSSTTQVLVRTSVNTHGSDHQKHMFC